MPIAAGDGPVQPRCQAPRFTQFLDEIFNGDRELIEFVQRSVGYALTGYTTEQCFWVLCGRGANGKSTLLKAMSDAVGDYGYTAPFSTFERYQRNGIPNDLAALAGRRFVISSETREGTKLNEGRLKSMTGGDALTARFLNQEYFTFQPMLKLFLGVNHKPTIEDLSLGWWRRVRLVEFKQTFALDKTLADTLKAEAPGGILALSYRGMPPVAAGRPPGTCERAGGDEGVSGRERPAGRVPCISLRAGRRRRDPCRKVLPALPRLGRQPGPRETRPPHRCGLWPSHERTLHPRNRPVREAISRCQ